MNTAKASIFTPGKLLVTLLRKGMDEVRSEAGLAPIKAQ